MSREMVKALLILPGTALVYVPGAILWLTHGGAWGGSLAESAWMWLAALLLAAPGLALAVWTVGLFHRLGGGGTPAPWAPITNLIVVGPYRHTRNPMITGVLFLLVAEALAFRSWPIFWWAVFFFALNTVYFMFSEEPGLERRYGDSYRRYKEAVPRWIPRLSPYDPGAGRETA